MAAEINIAAFKHVPFGGDTGEGDLPIVGFDWSAAAWRMEIRTTRGQTTAALITLTNATVGLQGISATWNAAYVMPDGTGTVGATIVRIQVDEATLEALAYATPANNDLTLYYDLHVTPTGLSKRVVCFGTFTIHPGATI